MLSVLLYIKARIFSLFNRQIAVKDLLKSIRFFGKNFLSIHLLKEIKTPEILGHMVSKSNENDERVSVNRSVILAEPILSDGNVLKKGVLLITFTPSFSSFLNHKNFCDLDKLYLFILEPSWTGYADPDILNFCQRATDLIVQATDLDDRALINTLYPYVKTIDIGASNWVDPDKFVPDITITKDIDLLYVANNNPVKRVYRLIEVVSELRDYLPSIKVVIVCANWGGNSKEVSEEIKKLGLTNIIELLDGLPQKELITLYNRSKASVLFSLKEGSNRVLFEGMFCNTPAFCLAENRGVNKSYINESTGTIAYDISCVEALYALISNYKNFTSREWAMKNISPKVSSSRLESMIKNQFGEKVNSEIKIKINDPEVQLLYTKTDKLTSFNSLLKK